MEYKLGLILKGVELKKVHAGGDAASLCPLEQGESFSRWQGVKTSIVSPSPASGTTACPRVRSSYLSAGGLFFVRGGKAAWEKLQTPDD